MEMRHGTWTAAIQLAVMISVIAAIAAMVISSAADVPQVAIVLTVIVVAFVVSWLRTDRVSRRTSRSPHDADSAPSTTDSARFA